MNQVLHFLNSAVVAFHQIPAGFWQALIASGVLSPLIKLWKSWRMTKREQDIAEWAMLIITVGVAAGAAIVHSLIAAHPDSPKLIALHTAVMGFMLTPTYILGVKPLWKFFGTKFGEASQLEKELQSAKIPAGGLPIQGTSVSEQQIVQDQVAQSQADFTS